MLRVEVVESGLPLLISLKTQKLVETVLNMKTDEAVMLGNKIK